MNFLHRFFYDDNATEGAGGEPAVDPKLIVNTTVDLIKPLFSEEEIKNFGFDNVDQMKQHLQQTRENRVPDETKKRNAEIEKAEFIKVATDEGLLNVDEFSAYENLAKKSDRDLVYEQFASQFKEDNPDATDELTRTEFESEYKLDSDKEKSKARGEARLKKEAEDLRSPLSGKYNAAKEFVDNYKISTKELPTFYKFVDDLVNELTPETFSLAKAKDNTKDDEDELDIPVKFTKEQRDEISKLFKTPKHFNAYLDNKDKLKETLAPSLTKKINSIIKVNNFDSAVSYALTQGKGIGRKKGSNVGAEQPFAVVKNMPRKTVIELSTQQELDASDKQLRQKFAK